MSRIFITGASGNAGRATLDALLARQEEWGEVKVCAALNESRMASVNLRPEVEKQAFDFNHSGAALKKGDLIFLLRPPALADVQKTFKPFIDQAIEVGVRHIVFISVQGVEKSSFIPHHGIEKLIMESGLPYTFLRNGYFMQNLTTTLLTDIQTRHELFVPAGKALFNWVDVADIGAVAAQILLHPEVHEKKAYEITGSENFSFSEVAKKMSSVCSLETAYRRPSLLEFYLAKRKQGVEKGFILVMLLLHYVANFVPAPRISSAVQDLLGRPPARLSDFLKKHCADFKPR